MARRGLVTITNTAQNRPAVDLKAVSRNLIPVQPTLDGLVQGIEEATQRAHDVQSRLAGAQEIPFPTSWSEALSQSADKWADMIDKAWANAR